MDSDADSKVAQEIFDLLQTVQITQESAEKDVSIFSKGLKQIIEPPFSTGLARLSQLRVPIQTANSEITEVLTWKRKLSDAGFKVNPLSTITIALPSRGGAGNWMLQIPSQLKPIQGLEILRFLPDKNTPEARLSLPHVEDRFCSSLLRLEISNGTLHEPLFMSCSTIALSNTSWRSEVIETMAPSRLEISCDHGTGKARMITNPTKPIANLKDLTLRGLIRDFKVFEPWFLNLVRLSALPLTGTFTDFPILSNIVEMEVEGEAAAVDLINKAPNVEYLRAKVRPNTKIVSAIAGLKNLKSLFLHATRAEIQSVWLANNRRFSFAGQAIEVEIVVPGDVEFIHTYHFDNGHWSKMTSKIPPHWA